MTTNFVSIVEAAHIAGKEKALDIDERDIAQLLEYRILPNFALGPNEAPKILREHALIFGGRVSKAIDTVLALLEEGIFLLSSVTEWTCCIQISRDVSLLLNMEELPVGEIHNFIMLAKKEGAFNDCIGVDERRIHNLTKGISVLTKGSWNKAQWCELWYRAENAASRISPIESLGIPTLYGNKSRVLHLLDTIFQSYAAKGTHFCDLMAGTGIVTRRLLQSYCVHSNDAAIYGSELSRSQPLGITAQSAAACIKRIRTSFDKNMRGLRFFAEEIMDQEEEYLVEAVASENLVQYRAFCESRSAFVPERGLHSECKLVEHVRSCRENIRAFPYCLTLAYWGNCYFGLRQAAEIDSLKYAIDSLKNTEEKNLAAAILIASLDACTSGPHYAQPPALKRDENVIKVIQKRKRSVWDEFELRFSLMPMRREICNYELQVSNLEWREGLKMFREVSRGAKSRAIYVDPPYSRLQYSRFYHVFETIVRYDYPGCIGKGRTSESSKRFTSGFDARKNSAIKEFKDLVFGVNAIDATLFLSYSTGSTVPIEEILSIMHKSFAKVHVYAVPVVHHSQGTEIENRGRRLEVIIIGVQ